ncbi:MAG: ABC transporter permease [Flavobacterium sp.]
MSNIYFENIKIALASIRTQLLRTILTVLIISIGIMALVGILTAINGLENTIGKNFSFMGSNTFNITDYVSKIRIGNKEEQEFNPIISYPEAKEFKDNYDFPGAIVTLSFGANTTQQIKYGDKKTDPEVSVFGVDENYLTARGFDLGAGRNFSNFDIINNNAVCLIGSDLMKALFEDESPLDKSISLRGSKFKIIGVLKEKGSTFGNNQDLRVLIPLQVARSIYSMPNINFRIGVMVANKDLLEAATTDATISMRKVRKLNPIEEDNFGIERSDELINQIKDLTNVLTIAAWIIGMITVLGSSIALMNIMLVSVTERTREIGIRKALGAKQKTIAMQFFTETVVIAQLGGMIGIIMGVLIGFLVTIFFKFEFTTPWVAITAALITCFIVALISGVYPAIKASKLDPIEALRHE